MRRGGSIFPGTGLYAQGWTNIPRSQNMPRGELIYPGRVILVCSTARQTARTATRVNYCHDINNEQGRL